ncbi:MAG: YifB family Mg chelatase-like AAA ATPase [Chloroflexi bacterium]|nr:YifB family Mg chelatase-like AAA ATPase [Chloroflexota bacterium]
MALARVLTCALIGLDGALVECEVDIAQGLFKMEIVGLPDAAVQEAKERVRSAIRNSGAVFPNYRITVNLAPAEVRKEGASYDLPIAVGILAASGQIPADPGPAVFLGELSLDGSLRHTAGMLPMVAIARSRGLRVVYVPAVDAAEAALVESIEVIPVATLTDLINHLRGAVPIDAYHPRADRFDALHAEIAGPDMREVKGQEHVKRALEIAASGGHNVLMSGPPGTGKTLLARCLVGILPPLSAQEALEVTTIYSVAGLLPAETPLLQQRPFRSPHHTVSHAGLVGGGRWPRPGELSLAHRGVLFLDELPEFGAAGLDVLRQPLEDGIVTISRAQGAVTYPARVLLVGAMNPCPCGYAGDSTHECTCTTTMIHRYQARLSGPLLDRIDLHVEVPRVDLDKLADGRPAEASVSVRERVAAARARSTARLHETKFTCNAEMNAAEIRRFCHLEPAAQQLLRTAATRLALSARAYHRIVKLARTIADLADRERIEAAHIAEALTYRPRLQHVA